MIQRRPRTWWNPFGLGQVTLRLLIIFLYSTAAMVLMFVVLSRQQDQFSDQQRLENGRFIEFERQIADNCAKTNQANKAFNAVLDQQAKNVERSTALKPAQKAQALETYRKLHLAITDCPAGR